MLNEMCFRFDPSWVPRLPLTITPASIVLAQVWGLEAKHCFVSSACELTAQQLHVKTSPKDGREI